MGGYGSGRRWSGLSKTTCESQKRIELAYLKKANMLWPGFRGTLSWTSRGEPSGWIRVAVHAECLELDYKQRTFGEQEWTDVNERIAFERTPMHFGGLRTWLLCPSCRRRCTILYGGGYFRCRCCQGLVYETQQEDTYGRVLCKARKIRARLGCDGSIDYPLPEKPMGMHWRTYERLRQECAALEEVVEARLGVYDARLAKLDG